MKKTLTVNLSGIVFHIDEDAYRLLDKYLKDIKSHLRQSEGMQEVMDDIESRISELFSEKISRGTQVITRMDVQGVIDRMGSPEAYQEGDDGASGNSSGRAEGKNKVKKKLYRDPDDKMLGGVASGVAAYLDCDATWVRLAFVVFTFFWGVTIPIYLLSWIIIPSADTTAEKLEMRGEEVTLENIGKTVTTAFNKVSDEVSDFVKSKEARSALQQIGDFFVNLATVFVKLLAVMVGVCAAVCLFALAVGFVAVLAVYFFGKAESWAFIADTPFVSNPEVLLALVVSGILVLGIPFYALLHTMLGTNFRWNPMSATVKWLLVIVWFIAIFVSIYFGIYVGNYAY